MTHQEVEEKKLLLRHVQGELDEAEEERFVDHYTYCRSCYEQVHHYIKEKNLIEDYLFDRLPAGEQAFFEKHYLGCEACFGELKRNEKFRASLREAVRQSVAEPESAAVSPSPEVPPVSQAGVAEKPSSRARGAKILRFFGDYPAVAAAAMLAVILLAIPAWRGIFKAPELERQLRQPSADVKSLLLQESRERARGPEEAPAITIGGEAAWVLLQCAIVEQSIDQPRYRAEILDHSGAAIWQSEAAISAGDAGVLNILCRGSFFRPGQYRLKVYELNAALQPTGEEFEFPFRISFAK